jgi:hypothetical protein
MNSHEHDQTVEAKSNERNAAGNQTSSHGYQAFETVVGNGEVFEVTSFLINAGRLEFSI